MSSGFSLWPASEAPPPGSRRRPGGRRPDKKKEKEKEKSSIKEDAKWLAYSDKMRDGTGFVEWTEFDHPQLGKVEIGGFVPLFRTNPPIDKIDALAKKQLEFVLEVASRLPVVEFGTVKVSELAAGLYEIETSLVNSGYFPTALAIGKQSKRVRPAVVNLDLPLERITGGPRIEQVWSIPGSGGRHKLHWVVLGEAGATVTVKVVSEKLDDRSLDVVLTPTDDKGVIE